MCASTGSRHFDLLFHRLELGRLASGPRVGALRQAGRRLDVPLAQLLALLGADAIRLVPLLDQLRVHLDRIVNLLRSGGDCPSNILLYMLTMAAVHDDDDKMEDGFSDGAQHEGDRRTACGSAGGKRLRMSVNPRVSCKTTEANAKAHLSILRERHHQLRRTCQQSQEWMTQHRRSALCATIVPLEAPETHSLEAPETQPLEAATPMGAHAEAAHCCDVLPLIRYRTQGQLVAAVVLPGVDRLAVAAA